MANICAKSALVSQVGVGICMAWFASHCGMIGAHPKWSGGQNWRWPTSEPDGYITPATWGIPNASVVDKIRGGPQVGRVAT